MIVMLMFSVIWQGALIVALTALVLRLVPIANATTRYAAWFATLLALVAIPLLTSIVRLHPHLFASFSHPAPNVAAFSLVPLGTFANGAARWLTWPRSLVTAGLETAIVLLWIAGAAFAFSRLAVSSLQIARIRRSAAEISQADGVPVLVSSECPIPIATGVFSPAIVLPRDLAQTLSVNDLRCTIEHELAHLRRGDVATNTAQRIVEAAFFWNPWIHVVGRRLAAERESACDDWAVRRLGAPHDYAFCLAELARLITKAGAPILTPSAFRSRNALVTRIERLMSDRSPNDSKLNYLALAGIVALFAVLSLAFGGLAPAAAESTGFDSGASATMIAAAATTCKDPNAPPQALDAVAPDLPKSEWPSKQVSAVVVVKVGADGKPHGAAVYRSSGNANVDRAVLVAAERSTYRPRLVNCEPSSGVYLFKAQFGP